MTKITKDFIKKVGCHDATTRDFCGHLVARHDPALFDATPFQVVSHDVDSPHQRENFFYYDCCNQCGHGIVDSYSTFKRWCYCIPPVYDEELDDLSSEAYIIKNMVLFESMLHSSCADHEGILYSYKTKSH